MKLFGLHRLPGRVLAAALAGIVVIATHGELYAAQAPATGDTPAPMLQDVLNARITQSGLDYLGTLLEVGLEQNALKQEIVRALEGQTFEILMAPFGGYARITVDYGPGRPYEKLDGFRYDGTDLILSSVPLAPRVPVRTGVIYPALYLETYIPTAGSEQSFSVPCTIDSSLPGTPIDAHLPELHVFATYPPFIPAAAPVSGVAKATLVTSGILTPLVDNGVIRIKISEFQTEVDEFAVGFPVPLPIITDDPEQQCAFEQALGQAILDGLRKEVNDALSGVFVDGLDQILFDRDRDGDPDEILNLNDMFDELNQNIGTNLEFAVDPLFFSNPVSPPDVRLVVDGWMGTHDIRGCTGPDAGGIARYTLLEKDRNSGHDPPKLDARLPDGHEAQFAVTLSDDFLNQILFAAYRSGLMCLRVDPFDPELDPDIAELLTTDTFRGIGGQWLYDAAPDVPVSFEIQPLQSPYVVFPNNDETFRLVIPEFLLNVYVYMDGRWLRAVGYHSKLEVGVIVDNINLGGDALFDLVLDFETKTDPIFSELITDRLADMSTLFPLLLDVAESDLAKQISNLEFGLVDCLEGVSIDDAYTGSAGLDRSGEFNHYFEILLSLRGAFDFNYVLSECFLGEDIVQPAPVAPSVIDTIILDHAEGVILDAKGLFVEPEALADGVGAHYRLRDRFVRRINAGGQIELPVLWNGRHRLQVLQSGESYEYELLVDSTPPVLRYERIGGRLYAMADEDAEEMFGPAEIFIQVDDAWQAFGFQQVELSPELFGRPIMARNGVGLETKGIVPASFADVDGSMQGASGFGCSVAGAAPPVLDSAWLVLLSYCIGRFWRRRNQACS